MDFRINKEQEDFILKVRKFTETYVKPAATEVDRKAEAPIENIKKMGVEGFMGIPFDKKYGGAGFDTKTYISAVEELSKGCASTGVIMSAHTSLCAWPIYQYGDEIQKENFLIPLAKGEKIGAFGWTEAQAGTRVTAVLDGENYIINGKKVLITNALEAGIFVVFAKTDIEKAENNISAFIIEKGTKGFLIGEPEDKMGVRGSSTCELIFENCIVPKKNILGEEGEGFKIAMATLNGGRIGVAAQAIGLAQGALDETIKYVKEREVNGKKVSQFQNTQFLLADLQTKIDAARLLIYKAADMKDRGEEYGYVASMSKFLASEVAMKATEKAVQLLGGNGYLKKFPVERMMRDAKVTEIYEGTSEVQKMIIANWMGIK
ncbi:acyl-CoA dehydrogenase family protein [Fusobacterium varium]|uniref:acyl-CoA dehydrogenase family protein n=1 Tax=Fusobacterium varium TaxID=856 RepID=UPI0035631C4C